MIKVIVRDFATEKDQKIWFNTPYHLRRFIRDICGLTEIPETVADALEWYNHCYYDRNKGMWIDY